MQTNADTTISNYFMISTQFLYTEKNDTDSTETDTMTLLHIICKGVVPFEIWRLGGFPEGRSIVGSL